MPKNNVWSQMFDIRPVDEAGDLDWKKIEQIDRTLMLKLKEIEEQKKRDVPFDDAPQEASISISPSYKPPKARVFRLGERFESESVPLFHESSYVPTYASKRYEKRMHAIEKRKQKEQSRLVKISKKESQKKQRKERGEFSFSDLFFPARFALNFQPQKSALGFAAVCLVLSLVVGSFSFAAKGMRIKGQVLGISQEGYDSLNSAIASIKSQNYESSQLAFEQSYEKFSRASEDLDEMGEAFIEISRFFPLSSKLSSGKNVIEAGKHIATAGQSLNAILKITDSIQNPLGETGESKSFLEIFQASKKELTVVSQELEAVQKNIEKIHIDDLPEDKRDQFLTLKEKIPGISQATKDFLENSEIIVDLLGGNGPRKYLFLFQNNQEMRATGGFVGSYGLMDISNGHIRNFYIDGIFNPDGQLQEKIVPPKPIQKISAAWSMHDSNWWPNFPTSAKEAISFFEKTGGPTADGVITLTPTVMQMLLKITGPIEMEEYNVTIDADNFVEKTQYEVEIDYDKEENKPKKILSDLAPMILDRLFNTKSEKSIAEMMSVLSNGLAEKHILLYSQNIDLQKMISERGWSGEVLDTSRDYLSVINSNINGFKTDGVIDEKIEHRAEIQNDGSVIDTVTITRHHNGGNSDYEWWNKVNADYLRVYVPLGSKLLEAEGQTRETIKAPLEYDALGFKRDSLVENEEHNTVIHEESGTRIYEEEGKTVFANWTYVSPQETMTLSYTYLLPFKVSLTDNEKPAASYSLLAQKQSGSMGSTLVSTVTFPKNYSVSWKYPEDAKSENNMATVKTTLTVDRFMGLVFTKDGILNN